MEVGVLPSSPNKKWLIREGCKAISMKSFLKSSRKAGSKKYLGIIGIIAFHNNGVIIIQEEQLE